MSNLSSAEDFLACASGANGPEWQQRADDYIELTHDWLDEDAAWAEWRNFRAAPLAAETKDKT